MALVDLPTNVTFSPARNHAFLPHLDTALSEATSLACGEHGAFSPVDVGVVTIYWMQVSA
jgi:hypothetical protein